MASTTTRTTNRPSLLAETYDDPPRLVERNFPFHQSKNVLQIRHDHGFGITQLTRHDLFHLLLKLPSSATVILLIAIWTASSLFFAGIYVAIDPDESGTDCRLRSNDEPMIFTTAFAFSIQTASGIGYTLPQGVNSYYEQCPKLQIAVYFQMSVSMLLNAFIISILIARLKNSAKRAVQLVFSDKAIVSIINGQTRFQIRAFDVNAGHPVVGAHVRLYAVKKDRAIPRALRLIQPNDAMGGGILLSLPQVFSHHIDLYSILHPPRADNPLAAKTYGLNLRQADSDTCARDDVVCRICSETFGTHEQWVRHVKYKQIGEKLSSVPSHKAHRGIGQVELCLNSYRPTTNLEMIKSHFEQEISEIICVVEGADPLTSGAFSGLQSYQASDIVWGPHATFHPCITVDTGTYKIDLDRFHDIIDLPGSRRQQVSVRVHDSFFAGEEAATKESLRVPQ